MRLIHPHRRISKHGAQHAWYTGMLIILCLCVSVSQAQTTASNQNKSTNDLVLTDIPTTNAARGVWRERNKAARETTQEKQSRQKLEDTLKKLKAIQFPDLKEPEPVKPSTQDVNQPVTQTNPEDNKTAQKPIIIIKQPDPQKTKDTTKQTDPANTTLSKATSDALLQLTQSPDKLRKPEVLAEILYHGKAYAEAALCYREAYDRLSRQTLAPSEDKAWYLFQLGNCLQHTNQEEAMDIIKQLISEYPHSLWSEMVRIKGQCITWEINDKPKELIQEVKQQVKEDATL